MESPGAFPGGGDRRRAAARNNRLALRVGVSGLALSIGATTAPPALAVDECGAPAGFTATCTPAGNNFPNGIQYQVLDLTVVVQDGVFIDTTGGGVAPGGISSGGAGNYGFLSIQAGTSGGGGVTITTEEADAEGIYARTNDGTITIKSFGAITTSGAGAEGIYAFAAGGYTGVTIYATGAISTGGDSASAIYASGTGAVRVTSSGDLSTKGFGSSGIDAFSSSGLVSITSVGDVSTSGVGAGIRGYGTDASVTIDSTGIISTEESGADGIFGRSVTSVVTITSAGDIATSGSGSRAIYGHADTGAGYVAITSAGDLSSGGAGIVADTDQGAITIDSKGAITTAFGGISASSLGGAIVITSAGAITGGSGLSAYSLNGDVSVTSSGAISTTGNSGTGIRAYGGIPGNVAVTSTGAISTQGNYARGIRVLGGDGTITSVGDISTLGKEASGIHGVTIGTLAIDSDGSISTSGAESSGIYASTDAGATIGSTGDIATVGASAFGIFGYAKTGAIEITSVGDISTKGTSSGVISATALDGGITIESSGDLESLGTSANAIAAYAKGGAVTVTSVGDIATSGTSAVGIQAIAPDGDVKIESTGAIATLGTSASAISATSDDGNIAIVSSGALSTGGTSANGVFALTKTGDIVIDQAGDVVTGAQNGSGIAAFADDGDMKVASAGDVTTSGAEAQGILAVGSGDILITSDGVIRTSGAEAHAIEGDSDSGDITIAAGTAVATGKDAVGIDAAAPSALGVVSITTSGTISGGWGTGAGIATDGVYVSFVKIQSGSAVGALSDRAVVGGAEITAITNNGTITGFVALGDGSDSFQNTSPTSWNLRNFADTDGDGVRDTEGVAIADFGAGTDSFTNSGTLSLASVAGASAFDTTGQITHPGGGNAEITQQRIEQGFLTRLESFAHSGLISLQDGAAGDLLVITDQADGGTAGNNVFTSNGGRVALDVVLDDGSSQQSDMLVLDKAVTGSVATTLLISNAGGAGGSTEGDGILVVNVRTDSDDDAFELGSELVAGAYRYELYFQNAAKTDENWYLRSSFFEGALDYPSISSGALETWYADLGSLHERLGERRRQVEDGQTAALPSAADVADTSAVRRSDAGQGGWLRVMGADMDIEQDGAADFDLNTVRAEAGFDVGFDNLLSDDWLVLGAFAGYGWSSLGFESDASADFDIATVGAYATYFRGPYYLDALVKFDWLDGNYRSELVGDEGDVELPVFGVSLETGYRFDLTQGGLYLQPEVQLSYAHVGDDRFADDTGAEIALEDADSLRGRIGARLGQELWSDTGAAKGNFYLEASASQEFLGETEANVTGLAIEQQLPETRFEAGAGFDIALPKDGVTFTLDADYVFGDEVDGVAATGGFRINW